MKRESNVVSVNGARLVSCDGQFQCRCTIFLAPNCDASAGHAQLNYEDGRSIDCPDLTRDFEFFSANCVHLRAHGGGRE
ncbi:hypothetical protein ESCO_006708 [Escovopsis weberi]|uniref:Uncharacterized protein n=1 Tax=Escovopsis weberi TaxID=150374 RepID=A0A0M9VVT0_ESCWE|nr:hypothetical protein ESCO_006708 [Escovopsis weberi]